MCMLELEYLWFSCNAVTDSDFRLVSVVTSVCRNWWLQSWSSVHELLFLSVYLKFSKMDKKKQQQRNPFILYKKQLEIFEIENTSETH